MEDARDAIRIVERLEPLGVKSRSTTSAPATRASRYLRTLPAGEAQDRQELRARPRDERRRARHRRGIVRLAHALGLKVVAEGVETEAQHEILRTLGCDELQGFLFARPMSPRALSAWAMEDVGPRALEFRDSACTARPPPAHCTRRPPSTPAQAGLRTASYNRGMKRLAYTRAAALPQILHERIVDPRRRDGHDDPALQARRGRLPRRALQGPSRRT